MSGLLGSPQLPQPLMSLPPAGLLGPSWVNPMMARQVAAQRAANPRPDVTDFAGYGPDWASYGANMQRNLQAQLMQPGDTGEQMVQKAMGMVGNFGLGGATVYHGSPHRFDKFDSAKIGTGEGAQAYGHGLYLAEQPGTAGYYKQAGVKPIDQDPHRLADAVFDALGPLPSGTVHFGPTQKAFTRDTFKEMFVTDPYAVYSKIGPTLQNKVVDALRPKGNLYKVDLPDEHIAKMLDWDKPLSAQPEVMKALKRMGVNPPEAATGADLIRGNLLKGLSDSNGIVQRPEQLLRSKGIPGIQYLDGGSRGAGTGTRNFVVFDDALPKIIGRE